MKAVVLHNVNDLSIQEVPVPEIAPDQALVRITHCGICGSDLRYLRGDNPWSKQTMGELHKNPPNMILGHEPAGIVEKVGAECDPSLLGKRVALLAFGTCGECFYCTRHEEQICPNTQHLGHGAGWGKSEYYYGGMAEYVPIYGKWLFPMPEKVSNEAAALLDPLAVAVHGARIASILEGETVLIIGAGPIGALAVPVVKEYGAGRIIVTDIADSVLDVALKMGADVAVNPDKTDLREIAVGRSGDIGPRVILDTVGGRLDHYLPLLARGGRYVIFTVTDETQSIRTVQLAGERSIKSTCNFKMPEYFESISLLEQGKINVDAVITHRFPLDQAMEGFEVALDKAGTGAVKVMLEI